MFNCLQMVRDGTKEQRKDERMKAVTITNNTKNENGSRSFQATCGKINATVFYWSGVVGGIQVICHNAQNKCWNGLGRRFENVFDAISGYRSEEMKSIIQASVEA
jgi:hypothetical protein